MSKIITTFAKIGILLCLCLLVNFQTVDAQQGCCSRHGGITGECSALGKLVCADGSESPSCACKPSVSTSARSNSANSYSQTLTQQRGSVGTARSVGCCKHCSKGKPCGNSCISRAKQCHQPPGCAC